VVGKAWQVVWWRQVCAVWWQVQGNFRQRLAAHESLCQEGCIIS